MRNLYVFTALATALTVSSPDSAAAQSASKAGINNVVFGAWRVRRRLRLGSGREDPGEGRLQGVGGATP